MKRRRRDSSITINEARIARVNRAERKGRYHQWRHQQCILMVLTELLPSIEIAAVSVSDGTGVIKLKTGRSGARWRALVICGEGGPYPLDQQQRARCWPATGVMAAPRGLPPRSWAGKKGMEYPGLAACMAGGFGTACCRGRRWGELTPSQLTTGRARRVVELGRGQDTGRRCRCATPTPWSQAIPTACVKGCGLRDRSRLADLPQPVARALLHGHTGRRFSRRARPD